MSPWCYGRRLIGSMECQQEINLLVIRLPINYHKHDSSLFYMISLVKIIRKAREVYCTVEMLWTVLMFLSPWIFPLQGKKK